MDFLNQLFTGFGRQPIVKREIEDLHIHPEMGAVLPAELRDLGNIVFTAGKGEGDQDIQIRKDLSPLLRVQVEVDVIGASATGLVGVSS